MKVKYNKKGFIITGTDEQIKAFKRKWNLYQFAQRTLHPTTKPFRRQY